MPDTLIPLGLSASQPLPPGIVTNGTMAERQGRWAGGNLVRFPNGIPKAFGGWVEFTILDPAGGPLSELPLAQSGLADDRVPYGAFGWTAVLSSGTGITFAATQAPGIVSALKQSSSAAQVGNITPTDWQIAPNSTGARSFMAPAFALLGSELLFCKSGLAGGKLYHWHPFDDGLTVKAVGAAGAPTINAGVFVTPESFAVAITGANTLRWASQGTFETWTPTSTNSAGGITIPTASRIIGAKVVRGQTLVFTEDDVWSLNYIGAPLYYGATLIGSGCGAVGPQVITVVKDTCYWMGQGGFFKYDGYIQQIRCDVAATIFTDLLPRIFGPRFFSVVNAPSSEIWWFYCSQTSFLDPDRVVVYNYDNDTWSLGALSRAAGIDSLWRDATSAERVCPMLWNTLGSEVFQHETTQGGLLVAPGAYIESGPFQLDAGQNVVLVNKLIPDSAQGTDQISLPYMLGYSPDYFTESVHGPFTVTANPSANAAPIDVRFKARSVRYKQTLTAQASTVGIPRLGVVQGGRR